MIAGAPGAWGSLVIFSSSCEMGWKPSEDRKSTRLNSSHLVISYAVFCLKKKKPIQALHRFPLEAFLVYPASLHHDRTSLLASRHCRTYTHPSPVSYPCDCYNKQRASAL